MLTMSCQEAPSVFAQFQDWEPGDQMPSSNTISVAEINSTDAGATQQTDERHEHSARGWSLELPVEERLRIARQEIDYQAHPDIQCDFRQLQAAISGHPQIKLERGNIEEHEKLLEKLDAEAEAWLLAQSGRELLPNW